MCSRFFLNVLRSIFTLSNAWDCFNMFHMKNETFSDTIYVIRVTKQTPECTELQHLKTISRCSMFALAFSPHRGLEVKESNSFG